MTMVEVARFFADGSDAVGWYPMGGHHAQPGRDVLIPSDSPDGKGRRSARTPTEPGWCCLL